jgi:hypothetical protein
MISCCQLFAAGTQGIQMNVPGEPQKIRVFLADNGLVAVLEKMTVSFVPFIEVDNETGEKSPHI